MHVIEVDNVSQALHAGLRYLAEVGQVQDSRAGKVLVAPGPVTTVYRYPSEKVLFAKHRDANPFFHLMESLWLLAGNDDAKFLDHYVKDFSSRFAEEGGVLAGSYGHRWRTEFGFDQLKTVIEKLKKDPASRQAVIQMWDCRDEPKYVGLGANDLKGPWRDRPCNTQVYFRRRYRALDMTVTCRSNDMIMGAYGANAVQFGTLLEYVAGMLGVPVGTYWQVSNDYHVYLSDIERLERRAKLNVTEQLGTPHQGMALLALAAYLTDNRYGIAGFPPAPLVQDPATFDKELALFMHYAEWIHVSGDAGLNVRELFQNNFLFETALQVCLAHAQFKAGGVNTALITASGIEARDWRTACMEWLERRVK